MYPYVFVAGPNKHDNLPVSLSSWKLSQDQPPWPRDPTQKGYKPVGDDYESSSESSEPEEESTGGWISGTLEMMTLGLCMRKSTPRPNKNMYCSIDGYISTNFLEFQGGDPLA